MTKITLDVKEPLFTHIISFVKSIINNYIKLSEAQYIQSDPLRIYLE